MLVRDGFELEIFGWDGSTVWFNKDYDIKFYAKKEVNTTMVWRETDESSVTVKCQPVLILIRNKHINLSQSCQYWTLYIVLYSIHTAFNLVLFPFRFSVLNYYGQSLLITDVLIYCW